MNTATEVKFTVSPNGTRRAQKFQPVGMRWYAISVAKAEALIAAGIATDLTNEWHIGGRLGL